MALCNCFGLLLATGSCPPACSRKTCPQLIFHHSWLIARNPPRLRCVGAFKDANSSPCVSKTLPAPTQSENVATKIGRGSNLVVFYSDHYEVHAPKGHKLSVDKFSKTRLLLEGSSSLSNRLVIHCSPKASLEELCLIHEAWYIEKVLNGDLDETEVSGLGPELGARSCASTGGTLAAMHLVMLGLRMAAASISGCREHSFSDCRGGCYIIPSGVFNDIAIAICVALLRYPNICSQRRPILVMNLDVIQDNSIREVFEKERRVLFFNMFGTSSYPRRVKGHNSYGAKLLDSTGDMYYLSILFEWLSDLLDFHTPSLVFFQAGVDALAEDISGRLSMTRQGLLQRNNIVYRACLSKKIPLVITMGRGCSRPIEKCIEAHADVYRSAALIYSAKEL